MLLEWGSVLNANKCKVSSATAIRDINSAAESKTVSTDYFDLSGRRVLMPSGGIYIKSVKTRDGQVHNQKVVLK